MNKKIKRAIAGVISAAALGASVLGSGFASAESADTAGDAPNAENGEMRDITAAEISKEMGLGINLGNTMEAYWLDRSKTDTGAQTIGENTPYDYETCWGAVVTTQESIDGIKEAGFNTVRIPVYWGNMMENDGTFTINEDYIARVKEIVDYCRNDGLYVVINCHHYDEFLIRRFTKENDLDGCAEAFDTIWTQIAEYFEGYSDYLLFEGFNEYLGGGPLAEDGQTVINLPRDQAYEWTNRLNQTFVDAVRATGGNNEDRVLIASGYWTNIDLTTSERFVMPEDTAENKLMVSVHYVDNNMYWSNKIGTQEWKDYSIDQCEKLKSAFTDKGIPVFVGETTSRYPSGNFGGGAEVTNSSDALDYMLRLITNYGFTPVLWDTNGNFYDRDNCKIKSDSDAEVIAALAEELKNGETPIVPPTPAPSSSDTSSESAVSSVGSSSDAPSSSETSSAQTQQSSAADSSGVSSSAASSASAASAASSSKAAGSSSGSSSTVKNDENAKTGIGGAVSASIIIAAGIMTVYRKRR